MSFNVEKYHQLTVTKKRNRIPTSDSLHNYTFKRVAISKVPCNRVDRNPPQGETHPDNCCKSQPSEHLCIQKLEGTPNCCPGALLQIGFVRVVLDYTSVVWNLHQQNQKSTLEMGQRQLVHHILHDLSPTSSASSRPGVCQVPEDSGEQGKMEETSCKIICGARTTLVVRG